MDGCHHVRIHARVKQFKNLSVTLKSVMDFVFGLGNNEWCFFIVLKRILLM